ncbi:MAG: hypothetical protein ACPG8W_10210 [Candidatus Promineifilaceae bacterium]
MQRNYLFGIFGCLLFILVGFIRRASQTEGSQVATITTCEQVNCRQNNADSPVGTNLGAAKDWSSEYPFIDAFKMSRPWITHDFADGVWDTLEQEQLNLDENGWIISLPTSDTEASFRTVGTLMFTKLASQYPEGEYTVFYEGEGTITYGRDAWKDPAKSSPGRDVIVVDHDGSLGEGGVYLQIAETDPNNTGEYIRNIRIAMPGFTEADLDANLFHPTFLESISSYKILRMMDWMQTNYEWEPLARRRTPRAPLTEPVHPLDQTDYNPTLSQRDWEVDALWEARPQEGDARYSSDKGVPWEIMLTLIGQIGADPWFNMPHNATNYYVWASAKMALETLPADRLVFVEYSNEVWNSSFGQSQWVEKQALEKWGDSGYDQYRLRYIWYGMRSAEVCQIWKQTWETEAHRIKCVLNTQATNSFVANTMLDCELYEEAPCDRFHDVITIAPYFGQHVGNASYAPTIQQWAADPDQGLDLLFAELEHGSELNEEPYVFKATIPNINAQMETYGELAAERGLGYMTYEGGQHLVGVGSVLWNDPIAELFAAANRDPRMAELYELHLDAWHEAGGQIYTHYSNTSIYSRFGNWGAQEYYGQEDAAKHTSIETHIATTPCMWDLCSERVIYKQWYPLLATNELP